MADETPQSKEDQISNMPNLVIDKILKRLPLKIAAKMSVLSRQWRYYWLSLRYLIFDQHFWEGQCINNNDKNFDWQKTSNIISSILLHHNGPVHKFMLYIPDNHDNELQRFNISQCLSFLSKNKVHKIILDLSACDNIRMPSYIYECKELVQLSIDGGFVLNSPPSDFKGFVHLRSLELFYIRSLSDHIFQSLVANCPQLSVLMLEDCSYMGKLVINSPNLETLTIRGEFEDINLNNVHRLRSISLCLWKDTGLNSEIIDAIKMFASSCELRYIQFGDNTCKLLAAFGITKLLTLRNVQFNHLHRLLLTRIDLGDYDVFCFTFWMLRNCPFIKYLRIRVSDHDESNLGRLIDHEFDYNDNYRLEHLVRVEFHSFKGSKMELKLIKYVLAIANVLEEMLFIKAKMISNSTIKKSFVPDLSRFPKASPKAIIAIPLREHLLLNTL